MCLHQHVLSVLVKLFLDTMQNKQGITMYFAQTSVKFSL